MTTVRQMRRDRMGLSEKVQGRHQDRLAIVYVRQSTLRQVEQHQESTRLQYALVERALQLGWARERIEVIDDDLGRCRRVPDRSLHAGRRPCAHRPRATRT